MAPKPVQQVHRFPILDKHHNPTGCYALFNVSSPTAGLPLQIEATEGEAPYNVERGYTYPIDQAPFLIGVK